MKNVSNLSVVVRCNERGIWRTWLIDNELSYWVGTAVRVIPVSDVLLCALVV